MPESVVLSWKAGIEVTTTSSVAPALGPPLVLSPWPPAAEQAGVAVFSLPFCGKITAAAVSLPIVPPKLKISSFRFGEPLPWRNRAGQQAQPANPPSRPSEAAAPKRPPSTRILSLPRPPLGSG